MMVVTFGFGQMSIAVSDLTPCQGDTITLTASGVPQEEGYFWYVTGATPQYPGPTDQPASVMMLADGYVYIVTPYWEQIYSVFIDVIPLPITEVTALPTGVLCPGTIVTLTATGAETYEWYDQIGNNIGVSESSIDVTGGAQYSVVGHANGCSYIPVSANITYEVKPEFSVQYTYWLQSHPVNGNELSVCDNQYVGLDEKLENAIYYTYQTQWFSQEPQWWSNDPVFSYHYTPPVTAGTYWFVVTTENSCEYVSDPVTITDDKDPMPLPPTKVTGATIAIKSSYPVVDGYQWFRNGLSIPGATNKKFNVKKSGSYVCRLKDQGCFVDTEPLVFDLLNVGNQQRIYDLLNDPEVQDLIVINQLGQWIQNAENLPSGIYLCTFITIWDDGEKEKNIEKILIE